jgi:hypothetical protein
MHMRSAAQSRAADKRERRGLTLRMFKKKKKKTSLPRGR